MSSGLVDWGLAHRLAGAAAGGDEESDRGERPFGPGAVAAAIDSAAPRVSAYTGLTSAAPIPRGEAVGRREWARVGIENLRDLSADLERRLDAGLSFPGPLNTVVRAIAGRAVAAEAGAAVGLAARRVLGQFDVALGESERSPRLLLVEQNLESTHRELGGDPALFLDWIALHETTHALQFGGVPWLRDHLAGLVRDLLDSSAGGIDVARLRSLARRLVTSDPRATVRSLLRGEATRLLAGPEQGQLMDRIQAAMAVVEGYAEHAMDHAAPERETELANLRARLEERRQARGGLGAVIARLLGLEMKLEQYRLGRAFCDEVVEAAGIDALNAVWSSPEALPTLDELADPRGWIARTSAAVAA